MSFQVDIRDDFYGEKFWKRISNGTYETDTIAFIENNCDAMTDFLDLGTANGAMMLIAAAQGANVYAYEPNPVIFEVARKNKELNLNLSDKIEISNAAVSSESGEMDYQASVNSNVLSAIVFTGKTFSYQKKTSVLSLSEELDRIHQNNKRRVVIKMDIEGAEWKILSSIPTVLSLKKHGSLLLLAVHPGFHRPFKKRLRGYDKLLISFWYARNYKDSKDAFALLSAHGKIYRTNLNQVNSGKEFARFILVGYHEFVIDFA